MSSNIAPILTLDASALDRLSFADLYHYRAGLDRLACSSFASLMRAMPSTKMT